MTKRLFKIVLVFTTLAIALLTLWACTEQKQSKSYKVRVALRECEGLSILSDNVVDVTSGKEVTFDIQISDDYLYVGNTANATYDARRGRLTVQKNLYPTTVELILIPKSELIHLEYEKNQLLGDVTMVEGQEWMTEPGQVTLSAVAYGGYTFAGWSSGGFLHDKGVLLSEESVYTFHMDKNTKIYANFTNQNEYKIVYDLCGGYLAKEAGSPNPSTTYTVSGTWSTMFPMQQTLYSNGTFARDGYIAVGYSTEPVAYEDYPTVNDMPGFSNMGGVCDARSSDSGVLRLYVVWAKETDASKFTFSGGTITKYNGPVTAKTIVIPEKINGQKVTRIAAGAFGSCMAEKLVIPKGVTIIDDNAFKSCVKLKEVVFFDGVEEVYNTSFPGGITTVVLNSQQLPRYSGSAEGSFCIKYERFRTIKGKKIAVVSGSSTLNGLDSAAMEEKFPGYSVINYGTNAANSSLFFIDAISKYVGEGDIIIHAPEFTAVNPMGAANIVPKTFRANEQCFDIFREVDMSKYANFWDSWRKFQKGDPNDLSLTPALNLAGKPYQGNTGMNLYGDLNNTAVAPNAPSFGNASTRFNYNILNASGLNAINKVIKANGGTLLMSFATFDASLMHPDAKNQAEYDRFTQDCKNKLDYPVISNVGTYIMEHQYFRDSRWHCNIYGRAIRTDNLSLDLRRYLDSVGR